MFVTQKEKKKTCWGYLFRKCLSHLSQIRWELTLQSIRWLKKANSHTFLILQDVEIKSV